MRRVSHEQSENVYPKYISKSYLNFHLKNKKCLYKQLFQDNKPREPFITTKLFIPVLVLFQNSN